LLEDTKPKTHTDLATPSKLGKAIRSLVSILDSNMTRCHVYDWV